MLLLPPESKSLPAILYCPNPVLPMNKLNAALSSSWRPITVRRLAQPYRAFPTDTMRHHAAFFVHRSAPIERTNRASLSAVTYCIGSGTAKKLKIRIVDGSAVMRKIVERALGQAGLDLGEVLEAGNGAQALVEVQKGSSDIIFSDINMPVMDGLGFLKSLPGFETAKGVPVIMITTEGSQARVVEALTAGAKAYLRKPRTPEQVNERVTPLLVGVS
jgi:two-component system chemotaxis response regulator CheY